MGRDRVHPDLPRLAIGQVSGRHLILMIYAPLTLLGLA